MEFILFPVILDWTINESAILKKELFTESTFTIIDKLLSIVFLFSILAIASIFLNSKSFQIILLDFNSKSDKLSFLEKRSFKKEFGAISILLCKSVLIG